MKSVNYKIIFFCVVLFYALIISQFGFENFDTGYLLSFSWRIVSGQDAYKDFIYKFPPVSIYFHAFFMKILPEIGQFYFFRILNYLFFAFQVFFTVSGFNNFYDLNKFKIDKWAIMIVCYLISIHNFIACPWPTTDSLLFVSIAFWMISKKEKQHFLWFLTIAFFTVFSAFCKQSFYLVPVFFIFLIFTQYNFKKVILFSIQILICLTIIFGLIYKYLSLENFLKQTTGETTLYQLYYSGIHNFMFLSIKNATFLTGIIFIGIVFYLVYFKQKFVSVLPLLKGISVVYISLFVVVYFVFDIKIATIFAFNACFFLVLYNFFYKKKTFQFLSPIIVLLAISWSTTISLGYPYPILFFSGIFLSFIVLIFDGFQINSKYYFWICLPFCVFAFGYNIKPYRESKINELCYSLEPVSPKLKFIKTNKQNFEKHIELKQLIAKYGKNYIVAPSLPLANYLFNNQSKLPGDWIINTEINRQFDLFIKLSSNKNNYVFLEKSFLTKKDAPNEKLEDFSKVGLYIYQKFKKIDETNYFIIYNGI